LEVSSFKALRKDLEREESSISNKVLSLLVSYLSDLGELLKVLEGEMKFFVMRKISEGSSGRR